MRTQTEIRGRYDHLNDDHNREDMFGFRREALLDAMEFDTVRDLLKQQITWHEPDVNRTARVYLVYAVDKALDHKGLSSSRSIEKLDEWLWVLGDDDLRNRFHEAGYAQYGAPQLHVLLTAWNIHPDPIDEPEWSRMIQGLPCVDDCLEGCTR